MSFFSKTHQPSLTLKGGSTSHLGLLPSGKKRKPLLLVALNRFAIWLADHQRSTPAAELRFLCGDEPALLGLLLMRPQGYDAGGLWERRDTMQEDYGTTLLIHQQYYTKNDSPHYNTSSDNYQFFGKSYFGSSKPIALHLSKLE